MFAAVYCVKYDLIGGIVAFACGTFEDVFVGFVVEVVVKEFLFCLAPKRFSFPEQVAP